MKWKEGGEFENPPAGSHIARCYALIDLGTQLHPGYQGKEAWTSRDVRISFELPLERMEGKFNSDAKGKPFSAHTKPLKQSLHPSSNLRKILEGWRGKKYSKDDLKTFDPKSILGKPCRLTLVDNDGYMNIDSVSPLGKGDKCPKQINATVFFSLEPDEYDPAVYAKLHERTRDKIASSPEYRALVDGGGEEPQQDAPDVPEPDLTENEDPF